MTTTFLILWILLALVSGQCVLFNWWVVIKGLLTGRKQPSLIPIVGGLLGSAAFSWAPWEMLNRLWWVPLVADLGCLPYLMLALGFFAAERIRGTHR